MNIGLHCALLDLWIWRRTACMGAEE